MLSCSQLREEQSGASLGLMAEASDGGLAPCLGAVGLCGVAQAWVKRCEPAPCRISCRSNRLFFPPSIQKAVIASFFKAALASVREAGAIHHTNGEVSDFKTWALIMPLPQLRPLPSPPVLPTLHPQRR